MEKILVLGMLLAFVGTVAFMMKKIQLNGLVDTSKSSKKNYIKKEYYLSMNERSLYEKIQRYLPGAYVIFPQVLLSSITKPNCDKKDFWQYQNKINRKTIDFVIFDKHYLTPVLAIELDGITHEWKNRQARDEFVDEVLDSSGIKIIHVKYDPRNEYRVEESQIINFINQHHPLQA